jgi:hypothetical protein
MKNIALLFFLVCLGLSSCRKSNPPSLHELFDQPIQLRSSIIEIPSLRLGNPFALDLLDTLLIINDWYPDKNQQMEYFTLVDIKNHLVIRRFGKEGKGPNEFLQPLDLHLNKNSGLLTTFAAGNQSVVSICLDSLILQGNFIVDQMNMLSHGLFTRGIRLNGNNPIYVGIGLFENAKYRILNASDENVVIDLGNIYNPPNQNYDNTILGMVFQGRLKAHPNEEKFVYCSSANDLLEIIDLKLQEVSERFESYYPKFSVHNGRMRFEKDNKTGYMDVAETKEYIYCLYSGRSDNEYSGLSLKANNIYVFDWNLNPIICYELDYEITAIKVTEDDQKLYSFALNKDDIMTLIQWDLNHYKKATQ